jgi:TolA-binding protein
VSRASCSRAWQAEAALDRRISAEDRASFERHVQTCETCARELDELSRLKQLGEQLPWPKAEPLQRRRQRNELLRRAHAGEPTSDARFAWRWVVVPAVLCLLALGVVAQRKLRVEAPVVPEAAVVYEVRSEPGSAWSKLAGGDAVRLALEEGALAIHVSKLKSGQSFSVQLPDGELEVRGTRFTVQVGVIRTERVTVSEGRVALRVRGRPEVLLGAGDTWQRIAEPAVRALPSAAGTSSAAAVPSSTARAGGAPRAAASAAASSVAPERAAEPSPASDFAIAMASFSRGDFATAEQLFQRFEARHPRSSQVEDSLFLRAVARLRRGDAPGARALAAEYLRRYPSGFRSAEAARLVNVP